LSVFYFRCHFFIEKKWHSVFNQIGVGENYWDTGCPNWIIQKLGIGDMGRLLLVKGRWEELAETAYYDANQLAKLCGVSTRHLQRHFRTEFHSSPQNWLNERRLQVAQVLLLSGESVKKVALDLGFKQTSHFCRLFKNRNKMTPSQFACSQITRCRSEITDVVRG
jgi:AraC-like DNA-binding protein